MIKKVFSVYDSKAQTFSPPFFMPTVGAAVRSFIEIANDDRTMVGRHPQDFGLFEIAEFDDCDGSFKSYEMKVNHGLAASYIKEKSEVSPVVVNMNGKIEEGVSR